MKKLLAAILATLLLFSLVACNRKDDDNGSGISDYSEATTYQVKDAEGNLLGTISYKAKGTDYAIITGYNSETHRAHSVVIPEVLPGSERTVVEIGEGAFKSCTYVTSVALPETVEVIGDWAFADCSSIHSMTIPANVVSIGEGAFLGCDALTAVKFAQEKPLLETIGSTAFGKCSALVDVKLPEGVVSIGDGAFFDCSALNTVALPQSLKTIGSTAFAKCDAITSITLGDNVSELGEYALGDIPHDALTYNKDTATAKAIATAYGIK